jgi:phospholipid N-methyltransferase
MLSAAQNEEGAMANLRDQVVFYGQIIKANKEVGAFSPTTKVVGEAVAAPIFPGHRPHRVLEVGSGTGTLTQPVFERLRPQDHLDLVEINPTFQKVLTRNFVGKPDGPQVMLLKDDIFNFEPSERYDVIVSSLPILNFPPAKVEELFNLYLERLLRPEGTLAYYDYWGKGVRRFLGSHRERSRAKQVLETTKRFHESCHYRRKVIVRNFPPACVHYLRPRG